MRHRQGKMLKMLLVLLAVAGMVTLPAQGWAQVPDPDQICGDVQVALAESPINLDILTYDTDDDGFNDYWECKGIQAADSAACLDWPGYLTPDAENPDNKVRLDPTKVNVFFIIKPLLAGSIFPPDPMDMLRYLTKPKTNMGLEIFPLFLEPNGVCPDCPDPYDPKDRAITLAETNNAGVPSNLTKAIRISESDDTSDIYLWGKCKQGTPAYLDACTIYTHSIRDGLLEKCNQYPDCELQLSEVTLTAVSPYENANSGFDMFIQKTIAKIAAHEGGHTLALSTICSQKTGICHNKGSGEIMEAFALFKRGTWKMGTYFDGANIDDFHTYESDI